MTYAETLEFLYNALPVFQQQGASAYKPGLENTAAMAALLGDPHRNFRAVHVAGTNGKGSTSHMLAAALQSSGVRTGLFTSPHLRDFRERIRIDGRMISEEQVVDFTEKWRGEMIARGLTFFEMCTLLAFESFSRAGVEVAVIETGLGGRLDATNIITPVLSIITNIGLDHMAQLGGTLPEIAAEKAGIIKPGVPVVIGERDLSTDPVFMDRAAALRSPLYFAQDIFSAEVILEGAAGQTIRVVGPGGNAFEMELDLAGSYQRLNLPGVLTAAHLLGIEMKHVRRGCAHVRTLTGLMGRWQVLCAEPLTVCDTGHNAHGLKEVTAQIARQSYEKLYMVLGVVAERDLDSVLPLMPREAYYFFTQPSTPRALPCDDLAAAAARYGLCGQAVPTVMEALAAARLAATPRDVIFIGGSTYTVADLF